MPNLRVVTWNSGGGAGGRGATLSADVTAFNATPPAVALVANQEARVSPGGTVYPTLTGGVAPFVGFINPPDHPRELVPGQPYAVGVNRSYLLSWNPGTLAAAGGGGPGGTPAAHVPLQPVVAPANGVENYILGLGVGPAARAALRLAAKNIRRPVRKVFTMGGGTVYFYTWHAELQANWLGASWATVGLPWNPFAGPGMYPAFQFLQNCDRFTADMAAVAGTATDVIIIAGDLNVTAADLTHATMFPQFQGVSNNLSHILAYSVSGAFAVQQAMHTVTPFPPHAIISAEVVW